MALSGLHVACGYVSAPPGPALLGNVVWSQTMAGAGVSDRAAPGVSKVIPGAAGANTAFEVRSSLDAWVAWGSSPDASQASGTDNSARIYLPAGETRNISCREGDKLAWAVA